MNYIIEYHHQVRLAAEILSVAGPLILAYRIAGLVKALTFSAECHETTILGLVSTQIRIIPAFVGSTEHIKRAQKVGLLITGFLCMAASGVLRLALTWAGQ